MTTEWNPQKEIALKVWEKVKRKAKRKGYIGYKNGDRIYVHNFPLFGALVYFPITRYYKSIAEYIDSLLYAEYEEITEGWTVKDVMNCPELEDDFDADHFLMPSYIQEEKKFIKIMSNDKVFGNIHGKEVNVETIAKFIKMIVSANWNVVIKEEEIKKDQGILNIELTLFGFDSKGGFYYKGMEYPFNPDVDERETAGCSKGLWVYRAGYSKVNLGVQPTLYLDWRVTVIHELGHIACLRHNILKGRECRDVEWFKIHNTDSCYFQSDWMVDEQGEDHGEQFKKAIDRFRARYQKAVEKQL